MTGRSHLTGGRRLVSALLAVPGGLTLTQRPYDRYHCPSCYWRRVSGPLHRLASLPGTGTSARSYNRREEHLDAAATHEALALDAREREVRRDAVRRVPELELLHQLDVLGPSASVPTRRCQMRH